MDLYAAIATKIIHDQESIIGPIAMDQARKVAGLKISGSGEVEITGDSKEVITHLVEQYAHLFGQASVEVCKDAVREVKPSPSQDQLPDILK